LARPLTIIHVVRSPIGGIFRHIVDLSSAQSAAGHRVGVVCDSSTGGAFEDGWIAALAPKLALGVTRLPMRREIGPGDLSTALKIWRHMSRLEPDIIHAHGSKGGVYGRIAAFLERRRGREVAAFYAPHGGSLHYDATSAAGRIYFTSERALEWLTDGLIHVSAYEAATYREKIGLPRCPAHVAVNGLRPEEFDPVSPAPDAADFLYIGVLRDLKGVDVFLQALSLLKNEGRTASALVIGAGEPADEARYREMAAALGGAVEFRAPMPAREAFQRARTMVVPSRAESMPYIVLEAAAAELPLIATQVGGIPEILDGPSERLVPPGDPAALAGAMRRALDAPAEMRAAARSRRQRLKQKFSLSGMASRVEAIYQAARERYRERPASAALEAGPSR
jgi:glycosyltransferase involved in cell wall biosynthesis